MQLQDLITKFTEFASGNLFPIFAIVNHNRRAIDGKVGKWMNSNLGRQLLLSVVSATVLGILSGVFSSYISLQIFSRDMQHLTAEVEGVKVAQRDQAVVVNNQLSEQRARIDRIFEMRPFNRASADIAPR